MIKFIYTDKNEFGAYSTLQESSATQCPPGCVTVPDDVDTSAFYDYDGFVELTIIDGIVTKMAPKKEEWQHWKSNLPDEPEPTPAPTVWDELAAAYQEGVNSIDE